MNGRAECALGSRAPSGLRRFRPNRTAGRVARAFAAAALLVTAGPTLLAAQSDEVAGRILPGEVGVPWAGAAIRVEGSDRIYCADPDGRFAVPVEPGTRLIVKPVGFPQTELEVVPADDEVLLPLGTHVVHIRGVVVTSWSTTLAGFGSTVDGDELARAPTTLSSGLQARVPGASVRQSSAAPGSESQLQIRGLRTLLGDSRPLIVIDGVPMANAAVGGGSRFITGSQESEEVRGSRLDEINPHDVEKVEVIEGPAATQRFGPRAANGVVSITTRRGGSTARDEPDPAIVCYRPAG
ncbi:TonB-dependent receptor plug domain-containing protein [Gaopeijia maritima]|uniref:TonB-dependent receptor plug domain-containing protein n=1 Tax=Gaopeijia maritima TaxID=3119007 RepID=A0ABU9E7H3_9BACT